MMISKTTHDDFVSKIGCVVVAVTEVENQIVLSMPLLHKARHLQNKDPTCVHSYINDTVSINTL